MNTFSHAGVSTLAGVCKARFANDATRVKVLKKSGHTDIDLIELPEPMLKEGALKFLLSINFDNGNTLVRATLEDSLTKIEEDSAPKAPKEPKAVKAPKEPKVPKIKDTKPSMEDLEAKAAAKVALDQAEDAPY